MALLADDQSGHAELLLEGVLKYAAGNETHLRPKKYASPSGIGNPMSLNMSCKTSTWATTRARKWEEI